MRGSAGESVRVSDSQTRQQVALQSLHIKNVISKCPPHEAEVSWGDGNRDKMELCILFSLCLSFKDKCGLKVV